MKKRNLFNLMFGNSKEKSEGNSNKTDSNEYYMYQLLNSFSSTYSQDSGRSWDIATVRKAVDAFCRHFGKINGKAIGSCLDNANINRLLQTKPNPLMESYSFYYKIAANLKLTNNVFIYPEYRGKKLYALWPLLSTQVQLVRIRGRDDLYVRFIFGSGKRKVIPYEDLIHIRGHFYSHDILGSNNSPLDASIKLSEALIKSLIDSSSLINAIRGILAIKTASKNEDLTKKRDEFVENNLRINSNGSGVIVTDGKVDYTPIRDQTNPISDSHVKYSKDEIYDYFGINDAIVKNDFTEAQWNAFYEGGIEPIAIQMSQAFTNCLYTNIEYSYGNRIVFESNRLQYLSVPSKISFVKELAPMGALLLDEIREVFNMSPLPDDQGKKIIQSLNWIDAKDASNYQIGKAVSKNDKEESNGTNNPGGESAGDSGEPGIETGKSNESGDN